MCRSTPRSNRHILSSILPKTTEDRLTTDKSRRILSTKGQTGPDMAMEQDELLDVSRAAVRLGLSPDGVRKRIQRGQLRGQKVGGQWRVILPAVEAAVGTDTTVSRSKTVSDNVRDAVLVHFQHDNARLQEENARQLGIIETQARTIEELTRQVRTLSAPQGVGEGPGEGIIPSEAKDETPGATPPPAAPETPVTPLKAPRWWERLLGAR
jgi:hypothetical protein